MCSIRISSLPTGRHLWVAAAFLMSNVLSVPALWAASLLDGELGLTQWSNDVRVDVSEGETESATLSGDAEVWWNDKWGLKGTLYQSDLDEADFQGTDQFSIDVKRRIFFPTDSSFLAVGLGWEDLDLDDGQSSSGARFVLEGRVGVLGGLHLYGQTAWFPSLTDTGSRSDLTGNEYEAGLSYDPFPFMSLRAGYRHFRLDFDDDNGTGAFSETSGFVFGAGFRW